MQGCFIAGGGLSSHLPEGTQSQHRQCKSQTVLSPGTVCEFSDWWEAPEALELPLKTCSLSPLPRTSPCQKTHQPALSPGPLRSPLHITSPYISCVISGHPPCGSWQRSCLCPWRWERCDVPGTQPESLGSQGQGSCVSEGRGRKR